MKIARFLALTLAIASLGACKTLDSAWNDIKNFEIGQLQNNDQREAAEIPLICPTVKIVDELSSLSDFSDLSDPAEYNLVSRVNLNQAESSCNYDSRNIVVDLKLAFEGQLGPRGKAKDSDRPTFSYPFFIAVTDDRGEIKAKEIFGASMTYNANEQHHTYYESLRQIIPVADEMEARKFTVLIGFQLAPQQLQYNRKHMVPVLEESRLLEQQPFTDTPIKVVRNNAHLKETTGSSLDGEILISEDEKIQITDAETILIEPAKAIAPQEEQLAQEKQPESEQLITASAAKPAASADPVPLTARPQKKPEAPVKIVTRPPTKPKFQKTAAKAAPTQKQPKPRQEQESPAQSAQNLQNIHPASGIAPAPKAPSNKSAIFRNTPVQKSALPPPPENGLSAPKSERDPISVIDLTAPIR